MQIVVRFQIRLLCKQAKLCKFEYLIQFRYLVKPVVRLQQGTCNKPVRTPGTHIPIVNAGLPDRRIAKTGQSFKESYDREWGQASSGLHKIDIFP